MNFDSREMKNRMYSTQEKRIAQIVKTLAGDMELGDIWEKSSKFTWRRPNTDIFSTIDRILFSKKELKMVSCESDWTLGFSDHAAVEVDFSPVNAVPSRRAKIARLDPSLAKDSEAKVAIIEGVEEMMSGAPDSWDPHMRLEFLKVCIRTVVERVQAERKRKEKSEEEMLNEELTVALDELEKGLVNSRSRALIDYIEELRVRKSILVENKGKRLAERLGTKWYNEGEKSNKYFMRLLNRANPDKFTKIERNNGQIINKEEEIETEVVNFYKELYEDFDASIIENNDQDFFQGLEPVSGDDEMELCKDVSVDELRRTLLTCSDSAPGPDGIPYSIIGLLWHIFGPVLAAAWKHSLLTKNLAPSHRLSYLKLIPKAGKNLDKLTNWRPITLSNCDHKLVTKTYAKRMCEKLAPRLGEAQTAYLKGRLINDNLRAILATVEIANLEERVEGLIVALDAKKAFDSVSHEYIEACLHKFGCGNFVPIFKTLYKDLKTDILINGRIAQGFRILRGVKQGDALSCILFIMCMEPLIRNIESNPDIVPIHSRMIESDLTKAYAYADDVSATIKDSEASLKGLFFEYERLTKMSGLELNADKTEIMRIGANVQEKRYNVNYMNQSHQVMSQEVVKLNGIFVRREKQEMIRHNVNSAIGKMENHFKNWSRRSLSTLGKILIAKTFGISQIVYIMQTLPLCEKYVKMINAALYKFIWNRHYQAAKAPERIKREIVNKPIKLGGFGMLDITSLDESLKIKAVGRLLTTKHPFLRLIRAKVDLRNFFNPKCGIKVDGVVEKGLELLKQDRDKLWQVNELNSHKDLMIRIRNLRVKDVMSPQGLNSVIYFMISRQAVMIKDLRVAQLQQLERYINQHKLMKLRLAIGLNIGTLADDGLDGSYFINNRAKPLAQCTSKEIRNERSDRQPIKSFKFGIELNEQEAHSWGLKLSTLTSTRHKLNLLRIMHGDVYTKDRLHRFGLVNDNTCPSCEEVETLQHKFIDCEYVKRIWAELARLGGSDRRAEPIKMITGTEISQTTLNLTIKAEIMGRILMLKDDQSYLIHPKYVVKLAIGNLIKKERRHELVNELKDLLGELD